jgi:hypothetical protein
MKVAPFGKKGFHYEKMMGVTQDDKHQPIGYVD